MRMMRDPTNQFMLSDSPNNRKDKTAVQIRLKAVFIIVTSDDELEYDKAFAKMIHINELTRTIARSRMA